MVERVCFTTGRICLFPSCNFIDSCGNVQICEHIRNPSGFHRRRMIKPVLVSVMSKHALRRGV